VSAAPSQDDIIAALKQSGYLMEQEVATQLERLDFHVRTNRAYQDADEGKSREMDVWAIKQVARNEEKKIAAYIEIIAECKNSANPFVFIGRPKNQFDKNISPQEYRFPVKYTAKQDLGGGRMAMRERPPFFHLGFDEVHYAFQTEAKAVQFCRIDRKGSSWHANHGGLYDAIFYPMAKAVSARMAELPKSRNADDWRYFWFFVPAVIVSGDIFYVDSTQADPVPHERDHVTFKRELRSGSFDGIYAVDFVRQGALERFVSECLGPIIERMTDLTMNETNIVLNQTIPWEE